MTPFSLWRETQPSFWLPPAPPRPSCPCSGSRGPASPGQLPCPALLSPARRLRARPAPQGHRGPGAAAAALPAIGGDLPGHVCLCGNFAPPPHCSEGRGDKGEPRCGAGGGGRDGGREAAQPRCARPRGRRRALSAEPRSSLRHNRGRWDLLPQKGWGGELRVAGLIRGRRRASLPLPTSLHLLPPPPPRRARSELPLSVRAPGASPRPYAVRCAQAAAAAAAEGEALALQLLFPRERRRQQEGEVVLCVEGTPIKDALTEGLLQDAPASPPSSPAGLNRDHAQLA